MMLKLTTGDGSTEFVELGLDVVERMRGSPSAGLSPLREFSACASARLLRNQNGCAACDFAIRKDPRWKGKIEHCGILWLSEGV
jgi:hypothetical protein